MSSHPVLDSLKKDLAYYNDSIKEVAKEIIESNFSKYPIFIAHQHEVKIGETILHKDDFQKDWSINASVLEEFVEANIVEKDKAEYFKSVFKDPEKYMCIFLVTEKGGNFIFNPYKNKNSSK
jgi:hypothetical protein